MKTAIQVLIAARALIDNPANWWDGRSNPYGPCDRKRCAIEAIDMASDIETFHPACVAFKGVVGNNITQFNDTHTHAEVLAAFDKAIERESGHA